MDLLKKLGIAEDGSVNTIKTKKIVQYINLKLGALGQPHFGNKSDNKFLEIAEDLLSNHREKNRLLTDYLCPSDQRIQNFIDSYLSEYKKDISPRLPSKTFILDFHGIARALSLSPDKDKFQSNIIESYRIKQGVLHNPKNDRRTTKGVFHVSEGGLPVPYDKKAVPKLVFGKLLEAALNPPKELLEFPFTSSQDEHAEMFVSLLLRPKVSPEVKGISKEKSMEIRFFAPGNLVSNLDFVESIFGNAGDPYLPKNDAGLDLDHWSGHSGCIILAPHLISLSKKELGLPNIKDATERQKRDGMCWENADEKYNDGGAFKITARNDEGIIVTVIADNYFGYSKKEVKTQISYAANLLGNVEEEHAGGAIAFPSYNLGDEFHDDDQFLKKNHSFEDNLKRYSDLMEYKEEGYAVDKNFKNIIYIHEDARFSLREQTLRWMNDGVQQTIKLNPKITYIYPAGYKLRMEKNPSVPSWRLIGTVAEGTFCHKPSTVSGGGKSEISKSISDSILYGPFFVSDYDSDLKIVDDILSRDYFDRYKTRTKKPGSSRPILSNERSLGSVIKLLTPSIDYKDEYNEWLRGIPHYIKGLVYIIKRFYKEDWGENWREHFTVDIIDGRNGNELKFSERKLVATYLRVGLEKNGAWRTYKLRQDFIASQKIQFEDDITASIVIPTDKVEHLADDFDSPCAKFLDNCEYRFFQRPDEAIHRGYDKQAELDLSSPNTFISNFQALTVDDAIEITEDAINFDKYTDPIKKLILDVKEKKDCTYFVSSSHPRIVEGKPSKNMRYLQNRLDILDPFDKYVAEIGTRLFRKIPLDKPVLNPVNSVLAGRRNNPPEEGIRPLAVYNPIHYQELPELFMDFICSLTGKSPSTTGAGSEGALTKAPFNALCTITDLNNALVSFILTGYDGFTTAAGYVGPNYRVDHDVSLLIPEIWARLKVNERNPKHLIENGFLEKLNDFEYEGETIYASRLGYRITAKFVANYFGRVFENPTMVFNSEMLNPEKQSLAVFVDGIKNITEAQKRVAQSYFEDGSIEAACPPLKALLNIMVNGEYEGKLIEDKSIREMFTREYLIDSEWYKERLINKQLNDISLLQKKIKYIEEKVLITNNLDEKLKSELKERLISAKAELKHVKEASYLKELNGSIGLDPLFR
ncbi:MAG: hypothetical protein K9J12_11165 [Melioribacteraceae bacterium]|nr:hypothetical protein [Melioribacteraceae bacterium]MCF8266178.1 hypothetical protein [Melioribacteraceae bacterium]